MGEAEEAPQVSVENSAQFRLMGQMDSSKSTMSFFLQNLDGGGAERAIIHLAGEIALQGHAVDLVVGYADTDYRAEVSAKVNLIDFGSRSSMVVFSKLVSYLHDRQPIVIMSALDSANIMMILAARLAGFRGRKVISQRAVLDASLRDFGTGRRWITRAFMATCFPRADALISNSSAAAQELNQRFGIVSEKIFTIHNAIDAPRIARLASEPLDSGMLPDERGPLVVSVGSLTRRKDVATLIRAFRQVILQRKAYLVIVGKGPERDFLEGLVEELGLDRTVHWVGFDSNPYRWMAAASVFVSSSTEEGFPNVIAEALALGRAVVATDCPGDTAKLLGHGKWGRLVLMGDPASMASAILASLDDSSLPDGRIRAADFSPSKITSAYLNVLLPEAERATGTLRQSA